MTKEIEYPKSYIDINFKAGDKWYKGYYEHLCGGSFRAYRWWSRKWLNQIYFEKEQITEWNYINLTHSDKAENK